MASPGYQHCASCIGTLSLPISLGGTVVELLVVTKANRTVLPKRQNNYENNVAIPTVGWSLNYNAVQLKKPGLNRLSTPFFRRL